MPSKNIIRVSEFEKLYYNDDKPFNEKHWNVLCAYLENVNKKETKRVDYFRILHKGIQFTNYVGVIQAGNLTIELLPKTDKTSSTAANETIEDLEKSSPRLAESKGNWHKVLLDMLKECRLLKITHVDYANLKLRSNSILEIYLELFLNKTEKLQHEGLIKKYQKKDGNQNALKGQLSFSKQIAYNSTHHERFYVRYTEYNRNNIYNQILYKTLLLVPQISNSSFLLDKVGRLLIDFPETSDITVTSETFNRLQLNRKSVRYKEALLISKMLLLNYRPDISGGSENVIAILFDMNKLWEEFVYRRLKKEEAFYNISVHRQQSENFWNSDYLSRPKTIRPDIVIKANDPSRTIVVDTKWKIVDDLIPSDEDLKQMYVYNLFWNCDRSVLLYPSSTLNLTHGDYYDYNNTNECSYKCTVQTTTIMDSEKKLSRSFGGKILDEVLKVL